MKTICVLDEYDAVRKQDDYDAVISIIGREYDENEYLNNFKNVKNLIVSKFDDEVYSDRGGPFLPDIKKIVDFYSKLESNSRVLIHCHAGMSRSPAVAIGLLVGVDNFSVKDAFNYVYNNRPIMSPNNRVIEIFDHIFDLNLELIEYNLKFKKEKENETIYGIIK